MLVATPPVPGLLSTFLGDDGDFPIGPLPGGLLQRAAFQMVEAASGAPVAVEVRTAAGGGGSSLAVSIADGERAGNATGSIQVASGATLYLRIVSAPAAAQSLSGWVEIAPLAGVPAFLSTLDRLKSHAGIASQSADALLRAILAGVSEQIQRYCRRRLVKTAILNEVHDASDLGPIRLREFPVDPAGLEVRVDGEALAASGWQLDSGTGRLYRMNGGTSPIAWASGYRNISVDYAAGYDPIPEDLALAATEQARHAWHQTQPSGRDLLGKLNKAVEAGGSVSYTEYDLLPLVRRALVPYRRVW